MNKESDIQNKVKEIYDTYSESMDRAQIGRIISNASSFYSMDSFYAVFNDSDFGEDEFETVVSFKDEGSVKEFVNKSLFNNNLKICFKIYQRKIDGNIFYMSGSKDKIWGC